MDCLVLKKKVNPTGLLEGWVYLIANGQAMGKWTPNFGVHCLADSFDCKRYMKIQYEDSEEETILEEHEVNFIKNHKYQFNIK